MKILRLNKNILHLSDLELLEKYKSSKKSLYVGELFKRHSKLTYLICMKYLKDKDSAKDAMMDIFEILISKLLTQEISNFKGWLYVVVKNHCLVRLKNNKNELDINEISNSEIIFVENNQTLNLFDSDEDMSEIIDTKLNELKDLQKTCLTLFYFEKKSYLEIAESENISVKNVKSYIQNGKRNLKILLEKHLKKNET